jgi:tetratricopeptide (TPR) repeat protein
MVLRHGYRVVRDENRGRETRIVAAVCFAAVAGIMATAVFFFPFRISVTLFMTSLILGIMEGLYIRSYGLLSRSATRHPVPARWIAPFVFSICIGILWQVGYRPLKGEWEHKRFSASLTQGDVDQAEKHLLHAISLDPNNTVYHFDAGRFYMETLGALPNADHYLDQAIAGFNGDVARWGVHFVSGLVKSRLGSPLAARDAFTRAAYYNPTFAPARWELERMDRLVRGHGNYHHSRKMPG